MLNVGHVMAIVVLLLSAATVVAVVGHGVRNRNRVQAIVDRALLPLLLTLCSLQDGGAEAHAPDPERERV